MALQKLPFFVALAPISPAFSGTPQDFATHLVERLRIVGPSGYYGIVVSDTAPTSNQGLWLKNGNKPYVWDDDLAEYVPITLTDSLTDIIALIASIIAKLAAGRIIFSDTAPVDVVGPPAEDNHTHVIWAKTVSSVVQGFYSSVDGITWTRVPGSPNVIVSAGPGSAYTGTASDPDVTSLSDLVNRVMLFIPTLDNLGPTTFDYQSFGAKPMVKEGSKPLISGDLKIGMRMPIAYDGTSWQLLSPVYNVEPVITYRESTALAVPVAGFVTTWAHGFSSVPSIANAKFVCVTANNGYSIGDYIDPRVVAESNISNDFAIFLIEWDAANVKLVHGSITPGSTSFFRKDNGLAAAFVSTDWNVVLSATRFVTT
jgi:hypothetical protein